MNVKKILGWGVVLFLAWFLITNPTGAAGVVTNILNGLKHAGNSLSTFFLSL